MPITALGLHHSLPKQLSIYKRPASTSTGNADLDLPVPYWGVCCCVRWLMALRRASLLMASECLPSSSSRSLLPASYRVAACRLEHLLPRCYSQEGATGGSSALDTTSNHFSYRGPLARTLTNLKVRMHLRQHTSTLCAAMLNDKGEAWSCAWTKTCLYVASRVELCQLLCAQAFSLASCIASFASAPVIVFMSTDGSVAAKVGLAGLMCGAQTVKQLWCSVGHLRQ